VDIEYILKIRTSRQNDDDFIAWQPDAKGNFFVKSAYSFGMEEQNRTNTRRATSIRPLAKPSPPKVRTFAWKLAQNGLATQVNMRMRKMEVLRICKICGQEDEDSFHALVTCPHARGCTKEHGNRKQEE
jgi:hypothetical protein